MLERWPRRSKELHRPRELHICAAKNRARQLARSNREADGNSVRPGEWSFGFQDAVVELHLHIASTTERILIRNQNASAANRRTACDAESDAAAPPGIIARNAQGSLVKFEQPADSGNDPVEDKVDEIWTIAHGKLWRAAGQRNRRIQGGRASRLRRSNSCAHGNRRGRADGR